MKLNEQTITVMQDTIISKSSILSQLKKQSHKNRLKLPEYIDFEIKNSTLHMAIKPSKRENGIVNYVTENMQTDNAAFEGWAICLKAWLPEMIEKVCLKWTPPAVDDNLHYNRFLYRVVRFSEAYDWFSIDNSLKEVVDKFKSKLTALTNNFGNKEPSKPNSRGEKYLEYKIVHQHALEFRNNFKVEYFNHQLPVGVKRNRRSFFTGGASAVDLWGLEGDTISIFELKYKNKMVGIISELFLYTCIIRDMIVGTIAPPDSAKCKRTCERELYAKISNITEIKAYMLSEVYHPLVTQQAIDLMNTNNHLSCHPKIHYEAATTLEAWLKF